MDRSDGDRSREDDDVRTIHRKGSFREHSRRAFMFSATSSLMTSSN